MNKYTRSFFVGLYSAFFILSTASLIAQEYEPVQIVLNHNTPVWRPEQFNRNSGSVYKSIEKNTIVLGLQNNITATVRFNHVISKESTILYENEEYIVPSLYLSSIVINDPFPDDWILDLNDENRKRWVITYYLDIFSSQKRGTILKYENDWIELCTEAYNQGADYGPGADWTEVAIVNESLFFFPASISLGTLTPISFWILQRKKIDKGYSIAVQGDSLFYRLEKEKNEILLWNLPFPNYAERKTFDLILVPDGDYMDVYLDTMKTKLASFAKVDASFLPELNKLIETNTCNPGNLTFWPRRANGSMDYPPPKGATNVRFTPTAQEIAAFPYATTSNLRLRSSATTSANIVTTIKQGTRLTVVSKGAEATIDGITAPWVQVITETGETGWCFGGYLDPRP